MKAIMSDVMREIILDKKKDKALWNAIDTLNNSGKMIGYVKYEDCTYKIKFMKYPK